MCDEDDEAEGSLDDEPDEDMGDACSDDDRAADSAAVQHSASDPAALAKRRERRQARTAGKGIVKRRSRAAGEQKTRASLLGGEILYLCELCGADRGVKADGMKAHRQEGRKCRKRRDMREMLLEKAKQQPPPPRVHTQ